MLRILCLTWTPEGSRRMHDLRSILNAEIWNYSIFYRIRLLSPVKYPIQGIKTLIKLAKTKPDVVVVQNPPIFAALTCLVYSRFHRVKVVIDHHFIWSMSGVIRNSLVRSLIEAVEKFCIRKADLNTTYADSWDYELTRIGGRSALTIYDFVDETWSKNADPSVRRGLPKDKKVIVMPVGGHPLERPELLVEACRDLNAMVVITGAKKFLQEHMARIRELKAENVVFTGFLPEKQYRGLVIASDFAANISEEPYGIPHALCEALASATPMIISRNPAVAKLLGDDCPLMIPSNDIDVLRSAFLSAFENQEKYVKLTKEMYEQMKERREKQLQKLLEQIYG